MGLRYDAGDGRLRGRAGMAQRKRRLQREPICRDCADAGRVTPSTVPDHIIPLARGGTDDDSNIRCLCADCHRVRTAQQFGHRNPVSQVDDDGWPISNTMPGGIFVNSKRERTPHG